MLQYGRWPISSSGRVWVDDDNDDLTLILYRAGKQGAHCRMRVVVSVRVDGREDVPLKVIP